MYIGGNDGISLRICANFLSFSNAAPWLLLLVSLTAQSTASNPTATDASTLSFALYIGTNSCPLHVFFCLPRSGSSTKTIRYALIRNLIHAIIVEQSPPNFYEAEILVRSSEDNSERVYQTPVVVPFLLRLCLTYKHPSINHVNG
jgi:hypothetical protein